MVVNHALALFGLHGGVKIRLMKEGSGGPDSGQVCRVKAKEIDTAFSAEGHISTDVQLRKARQSGKRRKSAAANPAHAERRNGYPTLAVKRVESKLRRHQRAHSGRREWPVGKQQIVPCLLHHPRTRGQGPWPMRDGLQERIHPLV